MEPGLSRCRLFRLGEGFLAIGSVRRLADGRGLLGRRRRRGLGLGRRIGQGAFLEGLGVDRRGGGQDERAGQDGYGDEAFHWRPPGSGARLQGSRSRIWGSMAATMPSRPVSVL